MVGRHFFYLSKKLSVETKIFYGKQHLYVPKNQLYYIFFGIYKGKNFTNFIKICKKIDKILTIF